MRLPAPQDRPGGSMRSCVDVRNRRAPLLYIAPAVVFARHKDPIHPACNCTRVSEPIRRCRGTPRLRAILHSPMNTSSRGSLNLVTALHPRWKRRLAALVSVSSSFARATKSPQIEIDRNATTPFGPPTVTRRSIAVSSGRQLFIQFAITLVIIINLVSAVRRLMGR